MMTNGQKLPWRTVKRKDTFKIYDLRVAQDRRRKTEETEDLILTRYIKMQVNGKSNKGLLRFTTAGSVDDGKSTLIGRLLYDSKSIFEDQMEHIVQSGKRLGREELDLSLLTDGLRAEREQGITIDVAYRYFATPARNS
jgi:hypothetical protein